MFMNLGLRQILAIFTGLCFAINVPAQDIPLLPGDPAVLKGVMPNGMAYYLVTNPDEKGVADFVLVQKTGLRTAPNCGNRIKEIAENALTSLKRIDMNEFLANHEIIPEKEGFIEVTDDATVFRFSNLRLDMGVNVMDSTLLMIMDIADRANYVDDEFLKKWYSPADQAVIVSGDIDSKSVASKLMYMSYMIPSRESAARPEYVHEAKLHDVNVSEKGNIAEVSATWTSKRAPRELMNTVQPEIMEMSFNTLGTAAVGRVESYLEKLGVPAADVSYSHICSSVYPYDDSFTIHVAVEKGNAGKAREAIGEVMASINEKGLMTNEYMMAESSYLQALVEDAAKPFKSNGEYVDRCRNAFMYNSSLASSKEKLAFHTSRDLPDTMRQRLFNGIASALIQTPSVSSESFGDIVISDTLSRSVLPIKMKLKSSRKEPVSGGMTWTFQNGFKVVYKKMASDRMYYTLALNGGFGNIADLKPGEGAFIADHFMNCRISDMKAEDFMKFLNKEGIGMDVSVNLSNMMISGSAPKEKTVLLLRSLLAVANERTQADDDEFEYYRKSEYLSLDYAQGGFEARMAAVDSIMCPGYDYSPYKVKGRIQDGFRKRAEKYFDSQFGKMNDGVLVLVGNMYEEDLKRILMDHVWHFRMSETVSRRPAVRYQPVSGWSTYTVEGESDNLDVAVSARMPVTTDNYMAASLAVMVMRRELAHKLNGDGKSFSLSYNCRIYPEERLNVLISIPSASLEDLSDVRSALAGMKSVEISDKELNSYKETLKNHTAREMKSPEYWTHAIALRYLDGKDLSTNYAAKIDAVTPEKVRSVLALLDGGSKVEYVTIKK